jgi:hypothetical protein
MLLAVYPVIVPCTPVVEQQAFPLVVTDRFRFGSCRFGKLTDFHGTPSQKVKICCSAILHSLDFIVATGF